MAEKEIVEVEVKTKESGTDEAAEKFVRLQLRIKEARIELQKAAEAGDQLAFNKAKQTLDDLNDELEAATLRSKNFAEILGQIPGPLGNIAAQTGGAIDKLKAFGKLTFADVKTAFAEFGKDLKGALVTLGNLTGVTKVYTTINNALAASFVKVGVGEAAAATGARAFAAALTATGIGAIVVALGLLIEKLTDVYNAYQKADEEAKKFGERSIELANNLSELYDISTQKEINRAKLAGKTEDEILKIKQAGLDKQIANENGKLNLLEAERTERYRLANRNFKMTEEEKLAIDQDINKRRESIEIQVAKLKLEKENNVTESILAKRKQIEDNQEKLDEQSRQRREKIQQKRLQDLNTLSDAQTEAFKQTLGEQEREEYVVNQKYASLIALATKYNVDTRIFVEAREAELADIRKKYSDKEIEDAKKLAKELQDERNDEFDQYKTALETRYAFGLLSESQFQEALALLKMEYAEKDKDARDAELEGIKFFLDKAKEYREQQIDINKEITQSYIDLGDNIATVFSRTATLFEQGSAASKVFGVLSVVANAASGIASAVIKNQEAQAAYNKTIAEGTAGIGSAAILLTNPVTAALGAARLVASKAAIATATAGKAASATAAKIQIGTISATSALQIAAILSAKKSTASAGGGAAAGAGGGGGTTTIGLGPTVGAPQVGAGAFNQQGQIAGVVAGAISANQSGGRPIRAYVVGNDITTEQQLQRRIRTAARLGG